MKLVWGVVDAVTPSGGTLGLSVTLDDGREGRAICYPQLTGECRIGDRVLLNTTAVDLELGTGGAHFVVARAGEGIALDAASGGHVMKLRYTPLQLDVPAVEAQESPHHDTMRQAVSLAGMPVVCCSLHSQVPLVAAAVKRAAPNARVVYCMSDEGALPLALSGVAAASLAAGLLTATVTCGQAFGGSIEAVNVHSGLLAARHVAAADLAIVALGPGVVGTGTPFGHGGVAQGEAINAAAALGGTPVACLRVSFADTRDRHRGVSHHTLTALTSVALAPAKVAVPSLERDFLDAIEGDLQAAGVWDLHERALSDEGSLEPPSLRGVEVTTMGRGIDDDPAFFAAAFAAGEIASREIPSVLKAP